jgi:formate dehydrogenase subunit delta
MSHGEEAAKLVGMANQISLFFGAQRRRDSAEAVAEHLHKFWTPLMRAQIRDHLDAGGHGLSDIARKGVALLGQPKPAIPAGPDDDSSEHARPADAAPAGAA